jgi:hypothetical protein
MPPRMRKSVIIGIGAALALGGMAGAFAWRADRDIKKVEAGIGPAWTEAQWRFPIDQWGKGKAFQCKAADCGTEVSLYLRAKIGFCNCTTGVADDEELERLSDFDLVGGEVAAQGDGRPISVAWMKGRSRSYGLRAKNRPGKTALSIAFNDRCDAVVATAVLGHDRAEAIEPGIMEFLNGKTVMRWAEVTLGL